jgi:hypothetical protein
LALEWANTRSNLTQDLDRLQTGNRAATFASRSYADSNWERELDSVEAEVGKLESEWGREAEQEQGLVPDSIPIPRKP